MTNTTTATETTTKTADLTKAQARRLTDKIRTHLDALPQLIHEAMQGRAYKALGYETVADWADAEFGLSRSRIYQISAWQSVEQKLRTEFALASDWTVPEEKLRHMGKTRMATLVAMITEAFAKDEEALKDEETRGDVVRHCVALNYGHLLTKKKAAKVATSESATQTEDGEGDEKTKPETAVKVPATIAPVALDRKVLVMKASDTASVLAAISEDEDEEVTLMKLTDAKNVIEELLAYYASSAEEVTA